MAAARRPSFTVIRDSSGAGASNWLPLLVIFF